MSGEKSSDIEALLAAVKFDEKGLATAVAVSADDGEVLMLAYMNAESLRLTFTTGYMTYWSRSRRALWVKGGTSGNKQRVISAHLDCDGDALLFKVMQEGDGAACHEGYRSCFFRQRIEGTWVVQGTPLIPPNPHQHG